MHLLSLLIFAILALCASLIRRDAQSVYDDITGIDLAVRNLTATLLAYNGGILESRPTFSASIAVHAVNRQGFADATASSPSVTQTRSALSITSMIALG